MYFHTRAQLIHDALGGRKAKREASDQRETATYYNQIQVCKVFFFFLASCHSYYPGWCDAVRFGGEEREMEKKTCSQSINACSCRIIVFPRCKATRAALCFWHTSDKRPTDQTKPWRLHGIIQPSVITARQVSYWVLKAAADNVLGPEMLKSLSQTKMNQTSNIKAFVQSKKSVCAGAKSEKPGGWLDEPSLDYIKTENYHGFGLSNVNKGAVRDIL